MKQAETNIDFGRYQCGILLIEHLQILSAREGSWNCVY